MESKFIRLKSNLTIHTYVAGEPTAPPLILLHGWPSSALLWRNIIPVVADHFFVLAPDLPGHGKSDKPEVMVYDLDCLRNFIIDFCDALDLKTTRLVAHDLGGMAALSLAVRHPERIEKLVIMNTSPYSDWHWKLSVFISLLKQPFLTDIFLNTFMFKMVLSNGFYDKTNVTPEIISLYREPWAKTKEGRIAFSKTIAIPPEAMVESRDNLRRIALPCLILWGKKDQFFPFGVAKKLHADIPDSYLVGIDKAGHFLQEEQPQQIADHLLDFL